MKIYGLILAGTLGLTPLYAQDGGIKVRSSSGSVETHGEAAKAAPGDAMGDGATRGDGKSIRDFTKALEDARNVNFADGDLTQDEINKLNDKAREKLSRDLEKFQEREREASREKDPEDKAEISAEITFDRYRASLRALERDLLYTLGAMRKAGGDNYEGTFDDLEEKIKDTFADLHDQIDDGSSETWGKTLDTGRKFHAEYHKQLDKWAEKIGVNPVVPNAKEAVVGFKKSLIGRIKQLRKICGDKYQDQLDDVEERIYAAFEGQEEKLEDADPKAWQGIVGDAEKFFHDFNKELDGWVRKFGVDDTLPSPIDRLKELNEDLDGQVDDLRRIGGDEYEDVIDEIADKIDDTFADLKDAILDQSKEQWPATLETAAKFHKEYSEVIDLWQRKILGANEKVERKFPDVPTPGIDGAKPDYPEKDVELPKGEHMDVVDGVRVARLMPLPKKQLGLTHGLSVNEIVDADSALARAGLEVYDIILQVGDANVDSRSELRDAVAGLKKGDEFEMTVLRDGEKLTLKTKK
ncbi:MAG: PDZ domain-containing protein [Planctomycetes bacterium]|nr:PDZ domain-containing protein [Planctomycetota bacterium]